jgi:hypothetical protein
LTPPKAAARNVRLPPSIDQSGRANKPGWLCCDVAFKSQIRGAVSLLAIFSMVRQDLREHARVKIMVSIVPPASLSATWLIYSGDHVI